MAEIINQAFVLENIHSCAFSWIDYITAQPTPEPTNE